MRRTALSLVLLAILACAMPTPAALADGDPGSDVLVYQPLFLAADARVSVQQQVTLGRLLGAASRDGFPIRVAIIASPSDLGAITGLWLKPQTYARFLGVELSLAYTGRLLVVMPNGFGFNWPGHATSAAYRTISRVAIGTGGWGLAGAAQTAVTSLAAARGVKLYVSSPSGRAGGQRWQTAQPATGRSAPGSDVDTTVALIVAALALATTLALVLRRLLREERLRLRGRLRRPRSTTLALATSLALAGGGAIAALVAVGSPGTAQSDAAAANPNLDPGTPLSSPAPDFTLTDELGQPVSLRAFRGKVVLLAFNDSECATLCPLTTTAMLDAKAMLGPAGSRVQLLGVDANPKATSLEDVRSYSQLHGMLGAWDFLTGSLPQLQRVWKSYGVQAAIQAGQISHTPALFVIDPQGRERRLYVTQQSYAAVGQLGQLVAQEISTLLPGHPAVDTRLSYSQIRGVTPSTTVALPGASGGRVQFGPGQPHLYLFFATWDQQITALAGGLEALGRYSALAHRTGLPPLAAIDEGSVEPPGALRRFVTALRRPLAYPVAVDNSGRVADGYEVQGLPWLMVVSASGQIAWYYSVAALGWPSTSYLVAHVREALARAASAPAGVGAVQRQLSGSPPALAALHAQAGRLLGAEPALAARLRALRGYPIVINVWASWCAPCRSEFGLFASASVRYGRRVAFLGADTDDSSGDARSFLTQHPVSYPSYQASTTNITQIAPGGLQGLPTTIFINSVGKLIYVHTGQYDSQGTLDGDIQAYALGG